jgi:hypothetical protein
MFLETLKWLFREYVGIEADGHMVELFMRLPYTRTQEYEADHIAVALLSKVSTMVTLCLPIV